MHFLYIEPKPKGNLQTEGYTENIINQLPELQISGKNDLRLEVWFGVSRRYCDTDNLLEPFKDILAAHYKFNDSLVRSEHTYKELVDESGEFIAFDLSEYDTDTWIARDRGIHTEYREEVNQGRRERYQNDPELREKQSQNAKERYQNDPEYRKKRNQSARESYHNDPEFRKKVKQRSRASYLKRKESEAQQNLQLSLF